MKRFSMWTVTLLTVIIFIFAITLSVYAAKCTSGDGNATCEGPCCNAGTTWCTAGPCEQVFKD